MGLDIELNEDGEYKSVFVCDTCGEKIEKDNLRNAVVAWPSMNKGLYKSHVYHKRNPKNSTQTCSPHKEYPYGEGLLEYVYELQGYCAELLILTKFEISSDPNSTWPYWLKR